MLYDTWYCDSGLWTECAWFLAETAASCRCVVPKVRMWERAKAAYLDRLKNRRPAADALPDPREDFGTAALDDAFVAGDN